MFDLEDLFDPAIEVNTSNSALPPLALNLEEILQLQPSESLPLPQPKRRRQSNQTTTFATPSHRDQLKQRKCDREKQRREELSHAFAKLSSKLKLSRRVAKVKILETAEKTITKLEEQVKVLEIQLANASKSETISSSSSTTTESVCVPILPRIEPSRSETLNEMRSLVHKVEQLYKRHAENIP